ncbi:MAG: O-antigen ligase family protein [Bdellovibrionota bacterium]
MLMLETMALPVYFFTIASVLWATSVPMGYPAGHFLHHLYVSHFLAILSLGYLLPRFGSSMIQRLKEPALRPFFVIALGYSFWMLLASILTPYGARIQSLDYWAKSILLPLLLAWVMLDRQRVSPGVFRDFKKGFLISGLVFFAVGALEHHLPEFTRSVILNEVRFEGSLMSYRASQSTVFRPSGSIFEHYNAFAVNQLLCALWIASDLSTIFLRCKNKAGLRPYAGRLVFLGIFLAGIAYSSSKTGLGVFVIGLAYLIVVRRRELGWKIRQILGAVAVTTAVVLGVFLINPESRTRIKDLVSTAFYEYNGRLGKVVSNEFSPRRFVFNLMQGREAIYGNAISLSRIHPIRGIGVFQTGHALEQEHLAPYVIHNHNILLSQLVEGGAVGLLLFLAWAGISLFKAPAGAMRRLPRYRILKVMMVTFLITQLPELFTVHVFWYSTFLFVGFALCQALAWPVAPKTQSFSRK